jgi:serine/threonine-protein kinase
MNPVPCHSDTIERFLADSLDADEQAAFERHLDTCDTCCNQLGQRTANDGLWSDVACHLSDAEDLSVFEPAGESLAGIALDFLDPTDDPHMLGRFAGYEIVGVIGIGGMGMVLKGFDRALNRFVAIKVLKPQYAHSAAARQRFAREARAAAAVVHENVVAIHGVSVSGSGPGPGDTVVDDESRSLRPGRLPYLVMPYIRGESLQKRLDRCGPLSTVEVLRIGMQVAHGLAAAHEQGLVHRDIKPANILLPEDVERVKITDFGLARAVDDASLTRTGVIAGTPQYMSPEQARGESVTKTSDLFSLGSVMYAMCTGRAPFRADTPLGVLRRIVDEEPRPVQEINSQVPAWLCRIVARLHTKSPSQRPHDAAEVAGLLKDCLAHVQQPDSVSLPNTAFGQPLAVADPPSRPTQNPSPVIKPKGRIAMFATLATVALAVFGWMASQSGDNVSNRDPAAGPGIAQSVSGTQGSSSVYEKEFPLAFANTGEPGELDVDIKRGKIQVSGHDESGVLVKLSVPDYQTDAGTGEDGLSSIRPNNLDFDIAVTGNRIEIDSNSQRFVTHLQILVPRHTNLTLDSYADGVVEVAGVSGHMNLRSQNNDIRLRQVSGSARVWSYNGDLAGTFDRLSGDEPLNFETYNGHIDIAVPDDLRATIQFRSGTGNMLTDFDIAIRDDAVKTRSAHNEVFEIRFEETVTGDINDGGPPIRLETEKGDIRLRKRSGIRRWTDHVDPGSASWPTSSDLSESISSREKIYQDIRSLVEQDQMPEYLLHAAHAGLLELQREQAIRAQQFEEAWRIEAELMLDYEKAISSYEAILDSADWHRRFPDMDPDDTVPYRRRLKFLQDELAERLRRQSRSEGDK